MKNNSEKFSKDFFICKILVYELLEMCLQTCKKQNFANGGHEIKFQEIKKRRLKLSFFKIDQEILGLGS